MAPTSQQTSRTLGSSRTGRPGQRPHPPRTAPVQPPRSVYLQARLRVRGQEGLARPGQEGLASREERPRGCRRRLAEVQEAHRARRLQGRPHGPLAREHGLLSLLAEGGPRLREG